MVKKCTYFLKLKVPEAYIFVLFKFLNIKPCEIINCKNNFITFCLL